VPIYRKARVDWHQLLLPANLKGSLYATAKAKKSTEKAEEDLKAKVNDKRAKDISAAGKKGKKDLSTVKAIQKKSIAKAVGKAASSPFYCLTGMHKRGSENRAVQRI
jgi:hypothetical protein